MLEPSTDSHEHLLIDLKHRYIIERIAKKYTRNSTVIWEDAAQTVYIKILEAVKAGKFRYGGTEEFFRWVTVVARYEVIDLVRRENRRQCQSLDQILPGTDLSVLDTIASELNLSDTIEQADFLFNIIKIIKLLDQRHPARGYLKLWFGIVKGKKQAQIAQDLGVAQPEVSKRRKELIVRIACELGLLQPQAVKRGQQKPKQRKRSKTQW
jgi:RNA polymerase sigma factor (sigma-70 family)